MCILFLYVANKAVTTSTKFKLILASNRDEKLSRPAKPAHFWDQDAQNILAGQDLQDFGTWLGVTKTGKLATLLNIMGPDPEHLNLENITSRGELVTGFLRSSPDLDGCTYLRSLSQDSENLDISKKYKPFHLITVDLLNDQTSHNCDECNDRSSIRVTYLTNFASGPRKPQHMTPPANACALVALGNSEIDKPFRKVACGRQDFENLVNKYNELDATAKCTDMLVEELLHFLKSKERYFPDEEIINRVNGTSIPSAILPHLSSRFVTLPEAVDYGTRTHTIVLVDTENNLTFHEWTREDHSKSDAEWTHTTYNFKMSV